MDHWELLFAHFYRLHSQLAPVILFGVEWGAGLSLLRGGIAPTLPNSQPIFDGYRSSAC
jgi:hypothetical protein